MRRLLIAISLLAISGTAALAQFASFDKAKFETLLVSNAPVVVHTHEWWCPTCRVQANVLEGLQKDPKFAKVVMLRASPGGDREALAPLNVTSRSVVVVFARGKEIGRLNWVTDEAQIRTLVERAAAQGS